MRSPLTITLLPNLVAHADWSTNQGKRWIALARLQPDGSYLAEGPQEVEEPGSLIQSLRIEAGLQGAILAGFDFPIGLPLRYAQACDIDDFMAVLPRFGREEWVDFYRVARQPEQISLKRPFYPTRPGNARQRYLLEGLGMAGLEINALRRRCELSHTGRRAAAPLFWTMGAQQVGKAAICGWKEMLGPALHESPSGVAIWPFSGNLVELLQPGQTVIVETYPAEFYQQVEVKFNRGKSDPDTGIRASGGKRSKAARQNNAYALINFASALKIRLSDDLSEAILNGFGSKPDGEDRFDAVIGLFGMLNIILGQRTSVEPEDDIVRKVEGWIFGQTTVV
jgi:hypothetical protein